MTRLLVIDTETGGTDPQAHSILSLAGVVWADGRIEDEFEILIAEPVLCVTGKALEINRINIVEHSKRAKSPEAAVHCFEEFLQTNFSSQLRSRDKVSLVGHNVGFDVGFLKRLYKLTNGSFDEHFSHRLIDTAGIVRYLALAGVIPLSSADSTEVFAYFSIDVPEGERHTALGDARATAELLTKLVDSGRG